MRSPEVRATLSASADFMAFETSTHCAVREGVSSGTSALLETADAERGRTRSCPCWWLDDRWGGFFQVRSMTTAHARRFHMVLR